MKGNAHRSVPAQQERTDRCVEKKYSYFRENADHVYLDVSLDDLKKESAQKSALNRLDRFCAQELGPDKPAIAVSTIYYDSNKVPIFAYFALGHRNRTPQHNLTKETQYKGRTSADVASWGRHTVFSDDGTVLTASDPSVSVPVNPEEDRVTHHVETSVSEDHSSETPAIPLGYKKSLQLAAQEREKNSKGIRQDCIYVSQFYLH